MNILFYVGSLKISKADSNYGGTESTLMLLADSLGNRGHNVCIYGPNVVIDSNSYPQNYQLINSVDRTKYDVIISVNHINIDFLYNYSDTFLIWVHNDVEENFFFDRFDRNSKVLNKIKSFIFVGSRQKNNFTKSLPEYRALCKLIPNFTDDEFINKNPIKKPENVINFVYTSGFSRGVDGLKKVWKNIQKNNPSSRLYICGPEYDYDISLQKYFEEFDNVDFLGSLDKPELYKLLSFSHYWLYPGEYNETFCIAGLEALQHRCIPVVKDQENTELFNTLGNHCIRYSDNLDNFYFYYDFQKNSVFENLEAHLSKFSKERVVDSWQNIIKANLDADRSLDKLDCVYIITLSKSDEYRQNLLNKVNKVLQKLPSKSLNIVDAVDGKTLDYNLDEFRVYPDWKIEGSDNDWFNRDMTKGEVGCALSHLKVWKHAKNHGYEKVLILEEDFEVIDNFYDISLKLPLDWDVILLGRQSFGEDEEILEKNYVKLGYNWLAHAYILNKKAINTLTQNDYINNLIPADDYLPLCFTKNSSIRLDYKNYYNSKYLKNKFKDNLKAYGFKEDLIKQNSTKETSQTLNTDLIITQKEKLKIKDMSVQNIPVDEWNRLHLSPALVKKEYDLIVDEPIDAVLHFKMFTKKFCDDLIRAAEQVNKWTEDRHDYYPTHDMLLTEIGFDNQYTNILHQYIKPLLDQRFNLEGKKWSKYNCENFIIKYTPDNQGHLSLHHDSSEFSCVVALNEGYDGGGTWFSRHKKLLKGKTGEISVHPGQITHRHGARPVISGTRYVLISFMKAAGD